MREGAGVRSNLMDIRTWLEGLSIAILALGMVTVGHLIGEPMLINTWAPVVFGIAVGYLGHGARIGGDGK